VPVGPVTATVSGFDAVPNGEVLSDLMFEDRRDAGRRLAESLSQYAGREDAAVLGLPRGGVPVAFEVATALHAPLDVFVVRKLGVPGHEELAMGAIASGGVLVLNEDVVAATGVTEEEIGQVVAREAQTVQRQEEALRGGRPALDPRGRLAIVVDDGLATGATMRAAIAALKDRGAAAIVVAVPAAPAVTCEALRTEVAEVVCEVTPEPFTAVGMWYRDFTPVSDDEVRRLLEDHASSAGSS
jgi:putative phosphoribosyl transferase